jgi:hypothetical protein
MKFVVRPTAIGLAMVEQASRSIIKAGHTDIAGALDDHKRVSWVARRIALNATQREVGMVRDVSNIVLNKE